jgi:hypothetical protein
MMARAAPLTECGRSSRTDGGVLRAGTFSILHAGIKILRRRGPRFETRRIAFTAAMPARADYVPLAVVAVVMPKRKSSRDKRKDYKQPVLTFSSDDIGPPMRPDGGGFMPLSQAAYWIATSGGTGRINDCTSKEVWERAYAELMPRIAGGEIEVIGRPSVSDPPINIEGHRFSGIAIHYPFDLSPPLSALLGSEPHIVCSLAIDEEWRRELNDKLFGSNTQKPIFTHLEVRKSNIASHWSFGLISTQGKQQQKLTRRRPIRDRVEAALQEIYPEGIPDQGKEPNKLVMQKVYKHLGKSEVSQVSSATILRAAKRRK